jgi:probable phosphoglycerate mutase
MTFPELYILRHGETVWNAENRLQGALNSPLTPRGEMQAARQFEILRGRDLAGFAFFSSPQGRAMQTAGIAVAPLAALIRTDERLREIGVGDWAGLLRHEIPFADGPDAFMAMYEAAPGGEGVKAVEARCRAFLADLPGPAVLVTHGITSRVLRAIVTGPAALHASTTHGGQGHVYHLKDGQQTLLS